MSELCYVLFISDTETVCHDLISLYFQKDRYLPYTYISGKFMANELPDNIKEVKCYINGYLVHHGIPDVLDFTYEYGVRTYSLKSRGFSVLLSQNEPVPGMNYNMCLEDLIKANTKIPYVEYQTNTAWANYIYVKEHSSIWDAITAYGIKVYTILPYIADTNTVMVIPKNKTTRSYDTEKLVSVGKHIDTRSMLSKVYMEDADGTYSHTFENPSINKYGLIREKYYALDRQWLSDPERGLYGRMCLANRRYYQLHFTYAGFDGEDIYDKMNISQQGITMNGYAVGTIEVNVRNGMILTTLYANRDENI